MGSLTSLFYGEQSEKEKSPSENSPLDADNKDVVSLREALRGGGLIKKMNDKENSYPYWSFPSTNYGKAKTGLLPP